MKAVQGYYLIKPEDLSWRLQPDANPERGLSGAHRKRESRRAALAIAAQKREHVAQTYPRGGILFRAGRRGPHPGGRRDVDRAEIRRGIGWAGPVAPSVQRYRRRGALAHRGGAGGGGISARCKDQARHVAHLSG